DRKNLTGECYLDDARSEARVATVSFDRGCARRHTADHRTERRGQDLPDESGRRHLEFRKRPDLAASPRTDHVYAAKTLSDTRFASPTASVSARQCGKR